MIQYVSSKLGLFSLLVAAQLAPTVLDAQIVSPESPAGETRCGPPIKKKDVLVLDLERFGSDSEAAYAFVARYVENIELESDAPETIRTALRSARKNRMSAMRRAQTDAAERGCNVVLVFRAWAGPEDAAYAHATRTPGGGAQAFAFGIHYAYATVMMGTGDH